MLEMVSMGKKWADPLVCRASITLRRARGKSKRGWVNPKKVAPYCCDPLPRAFSASNSTLLASSLEPAREVSVKPR